MFFEMSWSVKTINKENDTLQVAHHSPEGIRHCTMKLYLLSKNGPVWNGSEAELCSCCSSPTSIYERKWHWTSFSSRCIFDIYCYNPSGVHPAVLFHFWHTPAPIITPPNMGSITVSQQTIGAFSWHGSKKMLSEELIKTVTDPDPGPSLISCTTKWKKEWRSVFQTSVTSLSRGH